MICSGKIYNSFSIQLLNHYLMTNLLLILATVLTRLNFGDMHHKDRKWYLSIILQKDGPNALVNMSGWINL